MRRETGSWFCQYPYFAVISSMDSPNLVRTTPYFLLLSVGNVTLLLIVIHMRDCGLRPDFMSSREKLPGIQYMLPLVLMFGFLTALSGSLGLVGLGMEQVQTPTLVHVWFLGQEALEIIIKLALGSCILYIFDQRILSRLVSEMPTSGRVLAMHNTLLVLFLTCSTTLSYVSISKAFQFPKYVPAIFTLIASLIPLPLIIHFIRRTDRLPTSQLRVWVTLAVVQLFGAISSCFAMVAGDAFTLVHAAFLALWVSGMMIVFQMLHLPSSTTPHERSPTGTPSEDFLSLRDPFMFPALVSPGGTHLRSLHSTFTSRHSADMATITGPQSTHTIPRTKSTTSLPLLRNTHTSLHVREAAQTSNRLNQANSWQQRRVNSEPPVPLTRRPASEPLQEHSFWSEGSDDSLDYEFLSKIIIYPTDSTSDISNMSEPTSIAVSIMTASNSRCSHSYSMQTVSEKDAAVNDLDSSGVQEDTGEDCDMAHLEVETIRQAQYIPRYGPDLKPCSIRRSSPNIWHKLSG